MKKFLLLLIPVLFLSGCLSSVTLHPISKSDIFYIEKGTTVGKVVTEKDGWFLSESYVEEVMKAKID